MELIPGLDGTYFMCDHRGPRVRALSPSPQLKRCVVLSDGASVRAFVMPNRELTQDLLPIVSLGDIVEIEGKKFVVLCGAHAPQLKEIENDSKRTGRPHQAR